MILSFVLFFLLLSGLVLSIRFTILLSHGVFKKPEIRPYWSEYVAREKLRHEFLKQQSKS